VGLAAYQVVITRQQHRDELTCRVVPATGADSAALAATIAGALRDILKLRSNVEIVESLPGDAKSFVDERAWD
jgi:phenylacetate-CoA ligase